MAKARNINGSYNGITGSMNILYIRNDALHACIDISDIDDYGIHRSLTIQDFIEKILKIPKVILMDGNVIITSDSVYISGVQLTHEEIDEIHQYSVEVRLKE